MLRKTTSTLFALIAFSMASLAGKAVERPVYRFANANLAIIERIIQTDSAVRVSICFDKQTVPEAFLMVDETACLQAGGQRYGVVRAEGITLGSIVDRTGMIRFELFFPPLPAETTACDFIVANRISHICFWGLRLDGLPLEDLTQSVPDALKRPEPEGGKPWTTPDLGDGRTTLTIHILGYAPGMRPEAGLICGGLAKQSIAADIAPDGTATAEFDQHGAMPVEIMWDYIRTRMLLAPGDRTELYIDLEAVTRRRAGEAPDERMYYCSGRYAGLNRLSMNNDDYPRRGADAAWIRQIAGMDADEYTAFCLKDYRRQAGDVARTSADGEYKRYKTMLLQAELVGRIGAMARNLAAVRVEAQKSAPAAAGFVAPTPSPANWSLLAGLGINSYDMVCLGPAAFETLLAQVKTPQALRKVLGAKEGYLFDVLLTQGMGEQLDKLTPLTDAQKTALAATSPYARSYFTAKDDTLRARLAAHFAKPGYTVCRAPEVADGKLFDAILSQHAGKTVCIDFWATWCGPCCREIEEFRAAKEELEKRGVQFIYFTDESSDEGKWRMMVPDIKGDHYRFEKKRYRVILEQLGVDRIPSYMVVAPSGARSEIVHSFRQAQELLLGAGARQ